MDTAKSPSKDESLSESLLKALVKGKEEHRATKVALEVSQARVTSLSDENKALRSLQDEIKTLKAAKRMLEAIVKNRVNNKDLSPSEPHPHIPTAQEQNQAAKSFFGGASAIDTVHKSILYDVLVKQRETYETRGYPEENEGSMISDAQPTLQKPEYNVERNNLQDEKLFDLSVVSPITQSSRRFTVQERKIFRHFLDEIEPSTGKVQHSSQVAPERSESEDSVLIEVSPPLQKASTQEV